MDENANYRLEFWIDEFLADPSQTGFQLFLNERNDSFDEVLSEELWALEDAGIHIKDIATLIESKVIQVKDKFDGSDYSERAYYYFDKLANSL